MQIIKCTCNNTSVFTFELIFVCYLSKNDTQIMKFVKNQNEYFYGRKE